MKIDFYCRRLLDNILYNRIVCHMNTKATGFASPAQGYEEQGIDLNRFLIRNPPATYFFRLESGDMAELGLPQGSLLILDRSKDPAPNQFALIRHEGQFFCRLLTVQEGKIAFTNGEKTFYPRDGETEIIGTITASIKTYDSISH